jgi:AcrR family transcriptional regulator
MAATARRTVRTTRRRTQTERRDDSERGLIRAAIAVVFAEGVSAATFEAIAQRGGYSRGLVTHRFGSKRGLIEAIIAYLHARPDAVAAEQRVDELSGIEGILAYVDIYIRHLATDHEGQAYYRLLSSSLADRSKGLKLFAVEHRRFHKRLVDLLERGKAERNIRREIDAASVATMIGSIIFGVAMTVMIAPKLAIEPICESCAQTLRMALAPSGG